VALAACALLVWAAPVGAHEEGSIDALTVLDRVSPHVEGLEIRVVHLGAPALAVDNETGRVVEISGTEGEPFLRIGPDGVFANVESPTVYRSIDPNATEVPAGVDPAAPPEWVRFSREMRWSWFDPRLVHGSSTGDWSIPMTVGATKIGVTGSFEALEGHGHLVTDLATSQVAGLEIRLSQGPVPALYVHNSTARTLSIEGAEGEPFLRIGPAGVHANVRSPSYHAGGALTIRNVPAWASASASPRWKKISDRPVWGWLEYRTAVAPEQQERAGLGPVERVVHTWTIPMSLGGRPVNVRGTVVWKPPVIHPPGSVPRGRGAGPLVLTVTALLMIAGLARVAWRRPVPHT
jgi:hypothetical protein